MKIILTLACALSCTVSTQALAQTTLKFAHVYETGHPLHQGALDVAEKIEAATEGRVTIEVFPASSLGEELALSEGLSLGTVDLIYTGIGFVSAYYAPIGMTDYPFTLRGIDHWQAFRESELLADMKNELGAAMGGVEVAAVSYYGARHVTANKPVLEPADMEGLKIRVPNAPAYLIFPEATGANPTPMAFSEVYLGLQQGVVDAQENPLTTIQAKKLHEVQSDISLTGHIMNSTLTLVSPMTYSRLGDEDAEILRDLLKENATTVTDKIVAAEAELADWFRDQGVNVHNVDRGPFIEAVTPVLLESDVPFTAEQYEALQALPGNE
ncbi:sialic acid TRAP transporter substrate-binding protein SiaP [Paracoccus sp. 1_MG-2023]|uniref:sialic acid TRAP transporter substrate-binding protein SiaP n=1 Tax=unclassified Paracoccus (in: a-proteobacteria) TaxID=2688777 RepID=UPI001C08C775|nr:MULTISPECIES: sialic acid TRAP transporter substrate-binding protein SiaP [unclassified Paracoccus (in: a-proteobacteria)]MBU2958027.1 sialic acid TRAP transporter substrate-binding protein SiaP [Paracoccus sp. C2R09]MDO6670299.1 sialic acid TRAP transporter substrate-binding protein SiaP [Paracoccus sp. 1_MG-2023]